jgi:hypothetical protein
MPRNVEILGCSLALVGVFLALTDLLPVELVCWWAGLSEQRCMMKVVPQSDLIELIEVIAMPLGYLLVLAGRFLRARLRRL